MQLLVSKQVRFNWFSWLFLSLCVISSDLCCVGSLWLEGVTEFWTVFLMIPYRTAEEKREMVKHIKETIKRSMKAGTSSAAAPAARSSSFRRNNTEDRLNSSDPVPFCVSTVILRPCFDGRLVTIPKAPKIEDPHWKATHPIAPRVTGTLNPSVAEQWKREKSVWGRKTKRWLL